MAMMRSLTATLLVAACGAPAPLPTEPNPTEATSARVAKEPPPPLEFAGVITTRDSKMISSKVQAPIRVFHIQPGDHVKAGAVIAELETSELQNKLTQAQANLQAAEMEAGAFGAQLSALRQKMNAESRLQRLGVSSPMAVHSAQADYGRVAAEAAAASAKALSIKAQVEQARKDLDSARVVSPIDGVITNIRVHEGQAVQFGTPLARVFDTSDMRVKFAVPRDHVTDVRPGQRVELTLEGNPRPLWAVIISKAEAQEPPINFTVVEADIDDTRLAPGELQVASVARVRIPVVRGAER